MSGYENFDNDKLIEIFKIVQESEAQFDVWDWEYSGVYIWPLISIRFLSLASHHFHTQRVKLSFGPYESPKKDNQAPLEKTNSKLKSDIKMITKKKIKKILGVSSPEAIDPIGSLISGIESNTSVLFVGNTVASYKFGDYHAQHLIDSYRIDEEQKGEKTAALVVGAACTNELITKNWILGNMPFEEIQRELGARASKKFFDLRTEVKGFEKWERYICDKTGLSNLGDDKFYNMEIKSTLEYIDFFKMLFSRCKNMKRVYQVCYYGPIGYALNYVSRLNNVESIDIQHGVQGKEHRPYFFPNAKPGRVSALPEKFLVWSDNDEDNLRVWTDNVGIKVEKSGLTWKKFMSTVQHPETLNLQIVKNGAEVKKIVDNYSLHIERILHSSRSKFNIIVSPHHREELNWLPNFLEFCNQKNIFVWLRLHPGDLKIPGFENQIATQYEGLPISVHVASQAPLPLIFEHVNLHITKFSSTTIEADAYGVDTITYSKQGIMFFGDSCRNSELIFADGVIELIPKLNEYFGNFLRNSKPVSDLNSLQ